MKLKIKPETVKPDMVKNIIIGALSVLCLILIITQISSGGSQSSGIPIDQIAVSSSVSKDSAKIDRETLIRTATIEGISLSAKLDDVDGLAKKAGFTCEKKQPVETEVNWTCKHDKLEETNMAIVAANGRLISISRNGGVAADNLAPTMNMIEDMKSMLNTRKDVRFSQSEDTFSFSIRYDTNTGSENLDYNIMNQRIFEPPEPGKPMPRPEDMKTKLVYSAALSVPSAPPESTSVPEIPVAPDATASDAQATAVEAEEPPATEETPKAAPEEPAAKEDKKAEKKESAAEDSKEEEKVEKEETSEAAPEKTEEAPAEDKSE